VVDKAPAIANDGIRPVSLTLTEIMFFVHLHTQIDSICYTAVVPQLQEFEINSSSS
jgi:hypothetical protein